jgi:hypothetical protein
MAIPKALLDALEEIDLRVGALHNSSEALSNRCNGPLIIIKALLDTGKALLFHRQS